MKKVLRNSVVLVASLLVAFIAKATVIGGGTGTASSSGNLSVLGCGDDTNQQAKGIQVDCFKADGSAGKQCVTNETTAGNNCDMKVIQCQ